MKLDIDVTGPNEVLISTWTKDGKPVDIWLEVASVTIIEDLKEWPPTDTEYLKVLIESKREPLTPPHVLPLSELTGESDAFLEHWVDEERAHQVRMLEPHCTCGWYEEHNKYCDLNFDGSPKERP